MAATATNLDVARPVQRALGRSALYRLLSLACAYPSDDRIRALREEALPAAGIGAGVIDSELGRCLETLASLLSSLPLEELQSQYHRTFGHVSFADCPAYESAFGNANLFQQVQVMADVAGFYRAFGFTVSDSYRERVDHLAVELEFMHVLTYKEAFARVHHGRDKVAICRRGQRRFWRQHLGRWLPAFTRLLGAKAEGGVYLALARLLEAFGEAEAKALGTASLAAPLKPGEGASGLDGGCPWTDDGCPIAPAYPARQGG